MFFSKKNKEKLNKNNKADIYGRFQSFKLLLNSYIANNYKPDEALFDNSVGLSEENTFSAMCESAISPETFSCEEELGTIPDVYLAEPAIQAAPKQSAPYRSKPNSKKMCYAGASSINTDDEIEKLDRLLAERIAHKSDTFSEYLLYLIKQKGMENSEVHKRALVDKKLFSKIKNNSDYHPQKDTALRLCVGAKLNLDETKDLLARAGYALSPSDLTDIIFSFFIENGHYDMIDIDISLEEYGLPCIIS